MLVKETGSFWVVAGKTMTRPSTSQFGENILDATPQTLGGWLKVPLGGYSRSPQISLTRTGLRRFIFYL